MSSTASKSTPRAPALPIRRPPWWSPRGLRGRLAWTAATLILLAGGVTGWRVNAGGRANSAAERMARASAVSFLTDWVDPDGRVVRRDQGNDTVSEGQAYGMLLAVTADDRARFDQIWTWTKTHLQQRNSLLAWRWANGAVTDDQSAADADLDTIWALSLAGARFGDRSMTADAKTMAAAVLSQETVSTPSGRLLAAGPWARTQPATINPSYLVAGTATSLGRLTGDSQWESVSAATRMLDDALIKPGTLPPDWASVSDTEPAGAAQPIGAPGGGAGVQYGLDAPRLLIRLAASCDASDRHLAATATQVGAIGEPAIRSLSGQPEVQWRQPITDVAYAAVQAARGDQATTDTGLAAARKLQASSPTYYGAAWVALGQTLLTTRLLNNCQES